LVKIFNRALGFLGRDYRRCNHHKIKGETKMDNDNKNIIIPLGDWKARRAEQYVEAQMELAKKLRDAHRLADTMWLLADERADIAATRTLQAVIHGLEFLLTR
jgi:hypothetical protein